VLHLYAQPNGAGYLQAPKEFACEHPRFEVKWLEALMHLPMYEVPEQMAADIDEFVARVQEPGRQRQRSRGSRARARGGGARRRAAALGRY
jgi:hypothetical protein